MINNKDTGGQCSKTGSRVGIGIANFDLGRDRDWKFQLRLGSGFDRDPEFLKVFRGQKLLCEVLKINFENH